MEQNALLVCLPQASSCLHETKRSSWMSAAGQLMLAWNKTLFSCVCRRPTHACMEQNALLVCPLQASSCLHVTKRSSCVSAAGQLVPACNKTLMRRRYLGALEASKAANKRPRNDLIENERLAALRAQQLQQQQQQQEHA